MLYIPDNCGEVTWRYALAGDPEVMTTSMAWRTAGGLNPTDVQDGGTDVAQAWEDAWALDTATAIATGWSYRGYALRWRFGGTLYESFVNKNVAGTSAASTLPNNCTWLIQKVTGRTGRRERGRMYVPITGTSETNIDQQGLLASGTLTTLQGIVTDFYTNSVAAPTVDALVLLHTAKVTDPTPDETDLVNLQMEERIGTQRRRMRP